MSHFDVIAQPAGSTASDVLYAALADNRFDELRAAVAYITASGVQELQQGLAASALKRSWLTSFDWCRSDPAALSALQQQSLSSVKVHDGKRVVLRPGCRPTTSFHPKSFLFTGPDHALLLVGSANMSRNGLRHGVEVDAAIEVAGHNKRTEAAWRQIDSARTWFDAEWSQAPSFAGLTSAYQAQYDRRPPSSAVLEFGDTSSFIRRGFTAEQLAQVAHAQTMWIEAGRLTARTSAAPGHQLMMRPLTRVFFGYQPLAIPRKTQLGSVLIRFDGTIHANRTLEFAHNSMDRLNLPTSGASGAVRYDGKILRFTKIALGGKVAYELSIIAKRERNSLKAASRRLDLSFTMPGGRAFGFN
ncbi:phospholipase D family protein [Nocardioides donggukensis]|uniref:Phospholipase D family protein n=1 Tax=Nocardioides donggukensis TaxID=2774019 RepID=A0A927K4U0_9ACTN|nr:phospholipase D family protein [Nocardioides donggukensis]MBD8869886.1 phospholipase D family protein [Nocardioides donggukensis]